MTRRWRAFDPAAPRTLESHGFCRTTDNSAMTHSQPRCSIDRARRAARLATSAAAQTPAPAGDPAKGREKTADVRRLPRHHRLAHRVSRGLHGAEARRPARGLPRRGAEGVQQRRPQHPSMRGDRGAADGRGHGEPRRVLRAPALRDGRAHDDARSLASARSPLAAARSARPPAAAAPTSTPARRRRRRSARRATAWTATAPTADYPKLAGQHPDYLAKALRDYKSGARKNPIMGGMAAPLTPKDIDNLAAYYAAQPAVLTRARQ